MKILFSPLWFGLLSAFALALSGCEHFGKNPPPPELTEEGERGRNLYVKHRCFSCHGMDGSGNSSNILAGKPRDLRYQTTYVNGTDEEAIAKTILTGIPGTEMPAFPQIPEEERLLIAYYISDMLWEEPEVETKPAAKPAGTEPADPKKP